MKRKILASIIALVSCSFIVNAQIKEGSVLLGGQARYSTTTYDNVPNQPVPKTHVAGVTVSIGKALKQNTVYGINLSYANQFQANNWNGSQFYDLKSVGYGAGIFVRKYKPLGKDFYFFGEIQAGYFGIKNSSKTISGDNSPISKTSSVQLALTPGVSYQLLKKLQVEITIPNIAGLSYTTNKNNGYSVKQHNFEFNSTLDSFTFSNLGVGFRFVF